MSFFSFYNGSQLTPLPYKFSLTTPSIPAMASSSSSPSAVTTITSFWFTFRERTDIKLLGLAVFPPFWMVISDR